MIKTVNTEAEYKALTPDTFESSAVFVRANNFSHIDGVNAITTHPERGDIVALDESHNVRYIRLSTFILDRLSATWTTIGVVAYVDGKDVMIVNKSNTSKAWADGWAWKLTGYVCDGTSRTGVLSVRQASDTYAASTDYTISYNAANTSALVEQLNTYFKATEPFKTQDWMAKLDSDGNVVLSHIFAHINQTYDSGKSGFTIEWYLMPWYASMAKVLRVNGSRGGEGAISNMSRALAYFRDDLLDTTYNPLADVTDIKRTYPICLPGYLGTSQYQSDHCAYLRSVYGAGESGWKKFMASCLPVVPNIYGSMGDYYNDGLSITKKMAAEMRIKQDGTSVPFSPLATYCQSVSYDCDGVRLGEWAIPTLTELQRLMFGVEYGTSSAKSADALNDGLGRIGGSAISNGAGVWSCSYYVAGVGWCSSGSSGFFGSYGMCNVFSAVPVAHLILAEGED